MNAPRAQGYSHNPNLGSQAQGQYGINNGSQVGSQSDQSQYGVISGSQAGLPGSQGQKGTGNGSQIGAQYDQRHQSYGESGQKNKTGGAERVGGDEDDQDQAFHPHGEEEVDSMSQRRGAAGTEKSGNSGSVSTGSTSVKVSKFPQDGEHSATMAQLHKVAQQGYTEDHVHSFIHLFVLLIAMLAHYFGMTAGHYHTHEAAKSAHKGQGSGKS